MLVSTWNERNIISLHLLQYHVNHVNLSIMITTLFIQFCLIRTGLLRPHLWFWPTGLFIEGRCWVTSGQTADVLLGLLTTEYSSGLRSMKSLLVSSQLSVPRTFSSPLCFLHLCHPRSLSLSFNLFLLCRNVYFKGCLDFRALLKVQSCSLLL